MGAFIQRIPSMHRTGSFKLPSFLVAFPLLAVAAFALAQSTAPGAAPLAAPPADQPPSHTPPVTAKINALAHRVLAAGVKLNSLDADGLQPWHLKVDFQLIEMGVAKPQAGTFEEWSAGRDQWRRTYSSPRAEWNGSEWSVSPVEHYRTKPPSAFFQTTVLNTRVSRPVVNPLYQAANIKADYEMDIRRVTASGVQLNCVSVVDPSRYAEDIDFLFPIMCFDSEMHLRLTVAGDTSVQFDDIQLFQGRAVAHNVKVIQKGALIAEMKVSLLEVVAADAGVMKPPSNALREPYIIEPGQPRPESVFEVGASLPIAPTGFPYRGVLPMPILIRKDGTVKPNPDQFLIGPQSVADAIEVAMAKWKYKPYLVNGDPVDVEITVAYAIDGKPFVPSYERPKPPKVTTSPEDFSSSYDPRRDPGKDLLMAVAQAKAGNKRILLEVGGDWCVWCRVLDKFFADRADLRDLRDQNFVLMKVNMSALNENYAFLSQYPSIPGYPWIFVLDANGKLVQSQNTDPLEDGARGYSGKAIKEFLTTWKKPEGVASAQ
jgi:Thioredoxin-like